MIAELKKTIKESDIKDRKNAVMELFNLEAKLLDYSSLCFDNPCNRIVITENCVYAIFNIYGNELAMTLSGVDYSSVPAQLLHKGYYEKAETEMYLKLLSFLKTDATIIDVGANLGWYGLIALSKYPQMKIHSFEPVPETYERLKENYLLNGYSVDNINNTGMYREKTSIKFYYDVTESGASSMADLREKYTTQYINVNMVTMDDYAKINHLESVDFIKCDVEGSELFVYQGGLETIENYKPIVFSEMLRKWSAKFGYHPNDIISIFKEMGYKCFVIENGYLKEIDVVTDDTIETNFFFLHSQKHATVIGGLVKNA